MKQRPPPNRRSAAPQHIRAPGAVLSPSTAGLCTAPATPLFQQHRRTTAVRVTAAGTVQQAAPNRNCRHPAPTGRNPRAGQERRTGYRSATATLGTTKSVAPSARTICAPRVYSSPVQASTPYTGTNHQQVIATNTAAIPSSGLRNARGATVEPPIPRPQSPFRCGTPNLRAFRVKRMDRRSDGGVRIPLYPRCAVFGSGFAVSEYPTRPCSRTGGARPRGRHRARTGTTSACSASSPTTRLLTDPVFSASRTREPHGRHLSGRRP